MKKIFVIFFAVLISVSVADAAKKKSKKSKSNSITTEKVSDVPVSATVGYIFDGDTFAATVMLSDGIKISVRVRIIDIDAPEISGQCESEIQLADLAKNRLAQLLPIDSVIQLSNIKDDKYLGRIDARVKNDKGLDVSTVLINEKLARPYSGGKRKPWCE